ncbi:MAG TPA: NAD-dependent dehydratase [candidate division Zixibacteria bacterium]|nr:NAD-dependent dehydratase [candidate division Zixibacteria bacterium]HBZ00714.1 NAD-dependent dehydratase [candidate division Zixibacteria bacterium]
MINAKHIILGAGGAIGNVLADELVSRNEKVTLVGRTRHSRPGVETALADLSISEHVNRVIEESSTVYLLAGLQYKLSDWQEFWPKIMQNTITACKTKNAKLVFFDNVYMYGRVHGAMTEDTPYNPCSKKGEVRAKIADQLMSEAKAGNIKALIARSADFYGPYSEKSSVPFFLVIKRLADGKKAQWLVNARSNHSFTFTGDCGKALYLLAMSDDAINQVWHLPTASPPITGEQLIRIAAEYLGKKSEYAILSKWKIRIGGIFNYTIRESYEMLYQNEYDYIFDSSKFERKFGLKPTSYRTGIIETLEHFRQRGIINK